MKATVVLFTVFFLYQANAKPAGDDLADLRLTPLQEECLKQLNLADKRQAIHSLNNQAICPENNPEYNKFISCFWKKTNRQHEDGKVNYDVVRDFVREGIIQGLGNEPSAVSFAEENSAKIVNNCKDITGDNPDMVVVKVRNCIVRGVDGIGGN